MGKRTKLQLLENTRRRIEKRESEVDKLKREEIKRVGEAIFEKLGYGTRIELNYLSHSTHGINLSYRDGGFDLQYTKNNVVIGTRVSDETNPSLEVFKKLVEVNK